MKITSNILKEGLDSRGNYYSKEILKNIVNIINENQHLFGELGNNESSVIDLSKISHKIDSAELDGDSIKVNIEILDTPQGKLLKSLINGDSTFGCRGFGNIEFGEVTNYKLISVDFIK